MNTVSAIRSHSRTSVRSGKWFSENRDRVRPRAEGSIFRFTYIVFPMSLNNAPGLQILIASSKHCRAVRIRLRDSSSTRPTG